MPERERDQPRDQLVTATRSAWSKSESRQSDTHIEQAASSNGNSSVLLASVQAEISVTSVLPKVRPFDTGAYSANSKLKAKTSNNYLQTGKMLKYLDTIMDTLPESAKGMLVSSRPNPKQNHTHSHTAVDTLTYAEVTRHLTTLRTEHVQRFIRPVLQRLLLHPKNVGNLFNKPVDPVLLELPDYFLRIRRPMDLGTVKSRLQRGCYKSIESVTADIHLVFKNAISYNATSHAINLIARTMKADFEVDLLALEDKCARETDRKSTHTCTLCQGASCPLCGEKCLKFDPPVLVCHGTCLQRVKKNQVYYVTVDGIMLWCQRCYTGLPPLILELPGRPPLLKKNLLKRRLDEEVAEPWVSCDICGHWFHQICALYNDRMSISAGWVGATSSGGATCTTSQGHYECPLCKLEAMQLQCSRPTEIKSGELVGVEDAFAAEERRKGERGDRNLHPGSFELDETTSDSEMGDGLAPLTVLKVEKAEKAVKHQVPVTMRAETRSRAGAAKLVEVPPNPPKSIAAVVAVVMVEAPVIPIVAGVRSRAPLDSTDALKSHSTHSTLSGLEGYDTLSQPTVTAPTIVSVEDVTEKDEMMDVSEDGSVTTNTLCSETLLEGEGGKRERFDAQKAATSALPPHLNQWRASTLPRSHLSDFLEAMVMERLRSSGFEAAADTVTVRMTSNVEQYMEIPAVITDNLRTSEGLCLPNYLAYKQKCILMFQKVDGVDICLFCLYVQEFDEKCPEPNKSVVYIAYLDSVDFFRPMEARTLVYQEVMVGYFKWVQMRGFRQGHIWSCPPQRGDNFIFWCHPPHQRTPSRDRLNAWYNSILLRSSKLGVMEQVGTLWSACFSGYGRRESSGRKEKQAEESKGAFVGVPVGGETDPSAAPTQDPLPAASASSSSSGRNGKADSTTAAGGESEDAPVCPPVFEGDYWVTECLRVHRLVMGRSKGCDGQDRGVNQRKCRDLLKDLMSKPTSLPFCRPVDIVKLCIPDYPSVVTHPMDLGTIRDLLRIRYYKSILHFAEDVRLTLRNALKYNPPGHPINDTARLLSIEFESCLVDLLTEYIGAAPKAENVDKYLDSYPIADPVLIVPPTAPPVVPPFPPVAPIVAPKGEDDEARLGMARSKVPPLELRPLEVPRVVSRRRSGGMLGVIGECESYIGSSTPLDRFDEDETPRLCRADSMDSMQSYGSLVNDNSSMGDENDGWIPRLLFTSVALSGPIPCPVPEGPIAERTPFEKPTLGFKGAMALMSEIAKSVFRLKDDLFVIKFSSPSRERSPKKRASSNNLKREAEREAEGNEDATSATVIDGKEEQEQQEDGSGLKVKVKGVCFSQALYISESRGPSGEEECVAQEEGEELDQGDTAGSVRMSVSMATSSASDEDDAANGAEGEEDAELTVEGGRLTPPSDGADPLPPMDGEEEESGVEEGVPLAVSVPRPAVRGGRRGRDMGRKRSSHAKKSKSPRGRAKVKPILTAGTTGAPDGVTVTASITSTAAAVAMKTKGGKAGAYLRRISGERDLSGDPECEEELSEKCLALLANLIPDTSDPDPLVRCAFVDSRHTFLEMCQFRHYQFDSLRRAKHSSMMLLYHLHFPDNRNASPTCAVCKGPIRDVRWHCDQCADFDICDACCKAGEQASDPIDTAVNIALKRKEGKKKDSEEAHRIERHPHPLTPFRITYT